MYQSYDAVYFPIYQPKSGKEKSRLDGMSSSKKAHEIKWLAECEQQMDTEMAMLVKMKVRAAYKQHKNKMRVKPSNSKMR